MEYYYLIFIAVLLPSSRPEAIVLNQGNIDHYTSTKELMIVNFYADWCRYSQALKPIFDKAATQVHSETDKAVLGKVDCESERSVCQQKYHINKYPTLKIIRNGEVTRKEYRGQRSVEALVTFVTNELKEAVEVVDTFSQVLNKMKDNSKGVIGQYSSRDSEEYKTFATVAASLKDDCQFLAVVDSNHQESSITFRETGSLDVDYEGNKLSVDELKKWLSEKCIPLVREITFENGEEMTEEGLPFLILFYHPDHVDIKATFRRRIEEELSHEKGSVNFVTADGVRFAHPLSHLGKSKKDLPLIAIDSFKHMYVFPNFEEMHVPGKLKEFVDDLHSGKLHQDFHNMQAGHVHKHVQARNVDNPPSPHGGTPPGRQPTPGGGPANPPESTFKKLQPADSRYSLLNHDEL